jgi:DNA-binding CsgD family transcriptional regulator
MTDQDDAGDAAPALRPASLRIDAPAEGAHDNRMPPLGEGVRAMLEGLIERLFLRALQFVLGGVVFGIAFMPIRGRDSAVAILTAASLLALATAALRWRRALLGLLLARPALTLLVPVPPLLAVVLDGGFDSVWTPLVAITVGVPATLGRPWLSLVCALLTASGQAAAAWINRGDTSTARLVETTVFSGVGTIAVGLGIALAVATVGGFLHRRPQILTELRETDALLGAAERREAAPSQRQLTRAARTPLSNAELQVVARLAEGRAPKQIANDLGVTLDTVRSHLKHAKGKTHARTLPELVGLFIVENGEL